MVFSLSFNNQFFFPSLLKFCLPKFLVSIYCCFRLFFFLVMSSANDGARKKKKIEKLPLAKINRKLRDKPTFHVEGSSSQAVISNHPQRETLPLPAVNMAAYPPSVNSFTTTNIPASAHFPSDSNQGTLPLVEDLPSFAWEDLAQTYLNSFNQLWPQYISSKDVKHIERYDPMNIMLTNICRVYFGSLFSMFQHNQLLMSIY